MTYQLLRLWRHLDRKRHRQFYSLMLLLFAASIVEMVSIGMVLPFLGAMLDPGQLMLKSFLQPLIQMLGIVKPQDLRLPLTILFCMAIVLSGLLRLSMLRAQTRLSHDVGADISISIYRRALYQPYITHLKRNSSELISGITTKANNVVHLAMLPAFGILTSSVMVVSAFIVLMLISTTVALTSLFVLTLVYSMVIRLVRRQLEMSSKRISVETTRVIKILQEGLGGIRDVLIEGAQETYSKIYEKSDQPLRQAYADVALITSAPRFGIEALAMVSIALLAYFHTRQPDGLIAALPVIGAFTIGAQRMLPVIQQGYSAWSSIKGFQESLGDALDLLDEPIPEYHMDATTQMLPFDRAIQLKNISFRYANEAPLILKKMSLEIRKGSRVGFIGVTGSGKSTLLDIVMGLLQPSEGGLYVDNIRVECSNSRSWQANIAHVPQAIFLTDSTIAENIAFGLAVDQIDQDRVCEAAHRAQIGLDIESWQYGYNTIVGERGVRLSGGQRQRIGIARALYKKASVIIFDEATSALDEATEALVMQSIEKLDAQVTVLIIAHRMSTLKKCDTIFELNGGAVAFTGTYDDMMRRRETA